MTKDNEQGAGEQPFPEEDSWVLIDPARLDEECDRQVKLKLTYGKILAKQRRELARKSNELKVIKAEVDKEVRVDPSQFGIPTNKPPTEKAIENAVLLDPRVQTLILEEIEAEFWVGIREAEVYALSDRKSMLEKAVDLFLSDYHAAPKPGKSSQSKTSWEKRRDQEIDETFTSATQKSDSNTREKMDKTDYSREDYRPGVG